MTIAVIATVNYSLLDTSRHLLVSLLNVSVVIDLCVK